MALDPRILLMGQVPDVQQAIQNPLMVAEALQRQKMAEQTMQQQAQQAPIAQQLLEQRLESTKLANQDAQLVNFQKQEALRKGSFLAASQELLPELQKGNISKVKSKLGARIKKLEDAGIDSQDSRELMDWLDNNEFDKARDSMQAFIDQNKESVKPVALKEDARLVDPVTGRTIVGTSKTPDTSKEVTQQIQLRRDYVKASAPFSAAQESFGRIKAVFNANDPKTINAFKRRVKANSPGLSSKVQAFGDLALIFNFMKMLDPGSTVREGEFANAQNTGGVDDRFRNLYNQILNGSRLNDDQRQGIYLQSQGQFDSVKEQHKQTVKQELDFARKNAVEPKYIPESDLQLLNEQAQPEQTPRMSLPQNASPQLQNLFNKYGNR